MSSTLFTIIITWHTAVAAAAAIRVNLVSGKKTFGFY